MRSKSGFLLFTGLLLTTVACGEPRVPSQLIPTVPGPTLSPSTSASPSPTEWQTYSDSEYSFSIDYPPDFQTENFDPSVQKGQLKRLRFFDNMFVGEYPDGQIELAVYERDADSLESWVTKHSGNDRTAPEIYYEQTSNEKATSVNERTAIAFDFEAGPEVGIVHVVAFFSGERVITLEWFASTTYESTLRPIFERMIESYEE